MEPDGRPNFNNIQSFSSADYALLLSFAQNIREEEDYRLSFGVNAKVIHRIVGKFASAWGLRVRCRHSNAGANWRLGLVARDITTTFNAWAFKFTEREKEILYLTNNDIPVKSSD